MGWLLVPQRAHKGVSQALCALSPAPVLWAVTWGTSAQLWVHSPAQLCCLKVTPEHIDSRLAARQWCSCFLSSRKNSLLHRKSFYLWHSCFQPLELILQPDLPAFHAKFHARLFLRHKLLLVIVTISEKWLNTWLTNYDEIQEISVQPQILGITLFSSNRVIRKERKKY